MAAKKKRVKIKVPAPALRPVLEAIPEAERQKAQEAEVVELVVVADDGAPIVTLPVPKSAFRRLADWWTA